MLERQGECEELNHLHEFVFVTPRPIKALD